MKQLAFLLVVFYFIVQSLFSPIIINAQTRPTPSPPPFSPPTIAITPVPTSPIAGLSHLSYDSSGNLINDGSRVITWDVEGKPVKVTTETNEVLFIYDSNGGRIAKIVKDKSTGNLKLATLYLGGNLEKEINYQQLTANSQPLITTTRYYFANGKRIAQRKTVQNQESRIMNQELTFIHSDHLSSSTLFTDSQGNPSASSGQGKTNSLLTYYPYGEERQGWDLPIANSQQSTPTNHLYTDQIKDPETDLYYYNARYYDPTIGLFISADTAGDKLNKYAYANNNPLIYSDPTGHQGWLGRLLSRANALMKEFIIIGAWMKGSGRVMENYVESVYQGSQMGIPLENYNSQWGYMGFSGLSGFVPPAPKTSSLSGPIFLNEEAYQEMKQTTQLTQTAGDILMLGGGIRMVVELLGSSQENDPEVQKLLSNTEAKYGLKVKYETDTDAVSALAFATHKYDPETGISTIYGPINKLTTMHELGHAYQSQVEGEILPAELSSREYYSTYPWSDIIKREKEANLFASREMYEAREPYYGYYYRVLSWVEPLNYFVSWLGAKITP
ncbi:RHS repeat-associated core domain-containing protein [Candidatus Gottesmanbacteria bacterium]|nr:RHS repeat-associated core domain-containing protein [Candidatus Gottesmanbacteria bacterium]